MNLLNHEPAVRLGLFASTFLLMAVWELLAPRRRPTTSRGVRWFSNLGLVALDTVAVRFLVPLTAVGMAVYAQERGWGLFPNVRVPNWLAIILSVVALDFIIYLQHVLFHAVPVLWRLHLVHHADLDFDVTTGVRFHVLEIALSLGIKLAAVVLLGAPAIAVLFFEVLLNATSLWSHGNVRLPSWLDRILRLVLVTPDMHRVHHSVHPQETNSNFGFNLPWWDYLLGTYRAQPSKGHEGMTIGLEQFREGWVDRLHWMLLLPFIARLGRYPLSQRRTEPGAVRPATLARTVGQPRDTQAPTPTS
ncbi:MAG TPA: sterol desaturase family protein [Gemmataceae bacterium]|nr:sterol desaturase family protein [Gemmataceae bacterium]